MATISDPDIIEKMLRNNGRYPGDPQAARIYQYTHSLNGETLYATFYSEHHDDMRVSPFVRDAVLFFDRNLGLLPEAQGFLDKQAQRRMKEEADSTKKASEQLET